MDHSTGALDAIELPARRGVGNRARGRAVERDIAVLMADLNVGGVQRTTLALAGALAERGHRVDLVVLKQGGALSDQIPDAVRFVPLLRGWGPWARLHAVAADPLALPLLLGPVLLPRKVSATLPYLPALAAYLREARPDAMISATPHLNLEAVWARRLAGASTRLLISERSTPSQKLSVSRNWRHRFLPALMRRTYPMADVIVSVSSGLGDDLAAVTGLPRHLIRTIYNPVIGPDLAQKVTAPVDHPWLRPGGPPVLLAVGRLSDQKDFPTLLRAFARVRAERPVRLLILGGAKDHKAAERLAQLQGMAQDLGVAADVDLPGIVKNPFPYMARATVFVLSSRTEGLGNALIEALACGCQVVSTDCPVGPTEILEDGRYGRLVAVGDDAAMAEAIIEALDRPLPVGMLQARAAEFTEARAVDAYLEALFDEEARLPALGDAQVAAA